MGQSNLLVHFIYTVKFLVRFLESKNVRRENASLLNSARAKDFNWLLFSFIS